MDAAVEAELLRKQIAYLTDLLRQHEDRAPQAQSAADTTRRTSHRGRDAGQFMTYSWRRMAATATAAAAGGVTTAGERKPLAPAAQPAATAAAGARTAFPRAASAHLGCMSWSRSAAAGIATGDDSSGSSSGGSTAAAIAARSRPRAAVRAAAAGGSRGSSVGAKTSSEQLQAALRQQRLDAAAAASAAAVNSVKTNSAQRIAASTSATARPPAAAATAAAAGLLTTAVTRTTVPVAVKTAARYAVDRRAEFMNDPVDGSAATASVGRASHADAAVCTAGISSLSHRNSGPSTDLLHASTMARAAGAARSGAALSVLTKYKLVKKYSPLRLSSSSGNSSSGSRFKSPPGRLGGSSHRDRIGPDALPTVRHQVVLSGGIRKHKMVSAYKLVKRVLNQHQLQESTSSHGPQAATTSVAATAATRAAILSSSAALLPSAGSGAATSDLGTVGQMKYISKYKLVARSRGRSPAAAEKERGLRGVSRYRLVRRTSAGQFTDMPSAGQNRSPAVKSTRHKLDRRSCNGSGRGNSRSTWAPGSGTQAVFDARLSASKRLALRAKRTLAAASNASNKSSGWTNTVHRWRAGSSTTAGRSRHCRFFVRFGKCSKGGSCPFIHDPKRVAICTRFLRGTCRSESCLFSHELSKGKVPVCSYFIRGGCTRDTCPYLHVNVGRTAPPCDDFLAGYCPRGDKCTMRHSHDCPDSDATGRCPAGDKCKLYHSKRLTKKEKDEAPRVARPRQTSGKAKADPGSWWDEAASHPSGTEEPALTTHDSACLSSSRPCQPAIMAQSVRTDEEHTGSLPAFIKSESAVTTARRPESSAGGVHGTAKKKLRIKPVFDETAD